VRKIKSWLKTKLKFNEYPIHEQTQNKNADDFLKSLKQLFNKEDIKVFFDIGAHEGNLTREINKEFLNASIYAFEPFPSSYEKLSRLAESSPNIKAFPVALSSSSGTTDFFVNNSSETNSLFPSKKVDTAIDALTCSIDKITIDTLTLNEFCASHNIDRIDLVKLDTQGSELEVLKGSESLLRTQSISAIYCEVEFIEIYEKQPLFNEVFRYLSMHGYTLYNFYNLNSLETGQLAWADALFISSKKCQLGRNS
jgi:FkbM family methyltransferase